AGPGGVYVEGVARRGLARHGLRRGALAQDELPGEDLAVAAFHAGAVDGLQDGHALDGVVEEVAAARIEALGLGGEDDLVARVGGVDRLDGDVALGAGVPGGRRGVLVSLLAAPEAQL